jgi:ubiquinone/menaquinone biosynthesis C-methylase UbiE
MGRRNARVEDSRSWVFNRLAPFYRFRPPYPICVVDALEAIARPGTRVADLGAGTGSLSVPLAERGLRVCAVEPAHAMLSELRMAATARGLCIDTVHAAAESTGLPSGSFDLVLVADALHWLDPERAGAEVARLLASDGACAVVEVRLRPTPFVRAFEARIRASNPKAAPPSGANLEQLLTLAVPKAPHRTSVQFSVTDRLDDEQLRGTLCSLSYVGPALGPAALEELLADAVRIAGDHGGAQWPRDITLTSASR